MVDEGSKVSLLAPESPAFTWPNRITQADFAGWIEERGHGFMNTWDPRYEALVETHDPEQDPQKGGLLLARYGKGAYIYDAFALYRQVASRSARRVSDLGESGESGKESGLEEELRRFFSSLLQGREIGVGVFPESEELLIGGLRARRGRRTSLSPGRVGDKTKRRWDRPQ